MPSPTVKHATVIFNLICCSLVSFGQMKVVSFDQFMGTNGFINEPVDRIKAFGCFREYHNWNFNIPSGSTASGSIGYTFSRWNGAWDWDDYYQKLKQEGIEICPVFQQSPNFLKHLKSADRPVDMVDLDPLNPSSYSLRAKYLWQYAARYGSVEHDTTLLTLANGQEKKSGLDLVRYYEDWNEPDQWWSGQAAHFTPEQYAAMVSADVDGHGQTMKGLVGIKNADPNTYFVMGGLAKIDTSYLSSMKAWFEKNRPNQDWPIDVINIHHYCNVSGYQGTLWKYAQSPEDNHFKENVSVLVHWMKNNTPNSKLWVSEWGYDVTEASTQRIIPFADKDIYQIWSEWTIRTYLILSSTEVNRTFQYMLSDTKPETPKSSRFQSSGFLSCKKCSPSYQPKPGWFDVIALKHTLSGFYFDQVIEESDSLYHYQYHHPESKQIAHVLWSPTSDGSMLENYLLDIKTRKKDITTINFDGQSTKGVPTDWASSKKTSKLIIDIKEMPTIVIVR